MKQNKFPENARPVWAVRLAVGTLALSLALFIVAMVPSYKCAIIRPGVGVFGLGWLFLGLFSFCFSWAFPRRNGGGYYSRTSNPAVWAIFCLGFILLGLCCLLATLGYIPLQVKGCA